MGKQTRYQLDSAATAAAAGRTVTMVIHQAGENEAARRDSINEINALSAAARLDVLATQAVRIRKPHPATYIGGGTLDTLAGLIEQVAARQLVLSAELTVTQARNLEQALNIAVLDRTDLILTIFSRRATSHEGKLQVTLAQCRRQLARLAGLWTHLERQRGGIGLRGGPGEKQMELDRRLLTQKIRRLDAQIKQLNQRNVLARRRRRKNGIMTAALVGYTNAGKSALFNLLASTRALSDDQLFVTLDSTARRVRTADGQYFILSDTVGFIRHLPHELVAGFRATLADTADSDLLIIVVDASHRDWRGHVQLIEALLEENAARGRRLIVMNKIDRCKAAELARCDYGKIPTVYMSCRTGEGLDLLRQIIAAGVVTHRAAAD